MPKNNRQEMKQKTEFNSWSITYLRDIFECSKCKKRNTIVISDETNNEQSKKQKMFQNCLYCGNPNYV